MGVPLTFEQRTTRVSMRDRVSNTLQSRTKSTPSRYASWKRKSHRWLRGEKIKCNKIKCSKIKWNFSARGLLEILTNLAFLDFEGCFALKCLSCDCGFCAYCLQNCGNDARAHEHVANQLTIHTTCTGKRCRWQHAHLTVHRRSGKRSGSKRSPIKSLELIGETM